MKVLLLFFLLTVSIHADVLDDIRDQIIPIVVQPTPTIPSIPSRPNIDVKLPDIDYNSDTTQNVEVNVGGRNIKVVIGPSRETYDQYCPRTQPYSCAAGCQAEPCPTDTYSSTGPIGYDSSSTGPDAGEGYQNITLTCANILCAPGYKCENATCYRGQQFSDNIQIWINDHQEEYTAWVNTAQGLYNEYGYYSDPNKKDDATVDYYKPPPSYLPPKPVTNDPCYADQYNSNGYSNYGYDAQGYDPFGYDQAGYDRAGWSRYGVETNSEFNSLGRFKNPDYNDLHAKFYPNGTVVTTETGEVRRFDAYGFDQYGTNLNGYSKPSLCNTYTDPRPPKPADPVDTDDGGLVPTCPAPSEIVQGQKVLYLRKSVTAMTPDDWDRFRAVWTQLNILGKIGEYAIIHRTFLQQHNSLRFLPWHREFLARFENDMHAIDPCVTMPYWDTVASPTFPSGIATNVVPNFPPDARYLTNGQLTNSDPVTRQIGTQGSLPSAALLSVLMQDNTFDLFTGKLEQFHNSIHMYVGGDMAVVSTATQDPVFWMVHAGVDRIWYQWGLTHPNEPNQALLNSNTILDFTNGDTKIVDDVDNIEQVSTSRGVGYRYI